MSRAVRIRNCVACLLLAACGAARAADPPAPSPLAKTMAALVGRYRTETGATVGLYAVRLGDGAVLCQAQPSRALIPASNQKILTSAVARKRLGEDFRFRTTLAMEGKNLVVLGDGDPTTGDPRVAAGRGETIYAAMDRWAAALQAAGVKRIEGDLVIRAGIFQRPFVHPDWPRGQLQRWYAAPVAGVNFNDNCLDVGFVVHGRQVRPVITPISRFIAVDTRVRRGKRHLWACRFSRIGTGITLTGTVTRTTPDPLPVAVTNPPAVFGCVLADRLARAGIGIAGGIRTSTQWGAPGSSSDKLKPIVTETTPLSAALGRANKQSLNMMAECLFLRSAVEADRPATWTTAARTAQKVLAADYGLDPSQFTVSDGSGLSKKNRASPAALTRLLRALAGWEQFARSLSVGGTDGSLRGRFTDPAARGRVLGKTGSLAGVSALSGYILDRAGRLAVAFSILINGRTRGKSCTAKGLEGQICRLLIGAVDAEAGRHGGKAGTEAKAARPD